MGSPNDYRSLRVWQKAIDLGVMCYDLSREFPREEQFGLTSQLRRAAVSIAANIAEGNGRLTIGEYLNQLSISRGSVREVDTHLEFALRLHYATHVEIGSVREVLDHEAALLNRLIGSLKQTGNRR
jgi:four helix bundle protein